MKFIPRLDVNFLDSTQIVDGRTESLTPILHLAKSRCDNDMYKKFTRIELKKNARCPNGLWKLLDFCILNVISVHYINFAELCLISQSCNGIHLLHYNKKV